MERLFMGLSVLITASLLGFTILHAVTAPARPGVDVAVTHAEPTADGVDIHLRISNTGSSGFRSVTVAVDCTDPPSTVSVQNLPASGSRHAIVGCPSGSSAVNASVSAKVPV